MSHLEHAFAVILAGGGGTRLWPKSRRETPKQFLKLTSDKTMMQEAADRINRVIPWDRMIVVTNKRYIEDIKEQLPKVPEQNIIAEPAKKDTALAMLTGALFAKTLDEDAVIANMASDHVVTDQQEFERVMHNAVKVAGREENLVTVGITPTYPSDSFGYIKIGDDLEKLDRGLSLFEVESFTEKPTTATARGFISTGKYFWNANMYVWSAKTLLEAFEDHMKEMYDLVQPLVEADPEEFHDKLEEIYEAAEAISIDYAISEKAENLVLIPGDFGWNDVGIWKTVYDLGKKDLNGNVIVGEGDEVHTLTVNSQNNLVHTNGRLVALVDVDDLVVVDTEDIVMVVPKGKTSDVKKLVNRLKEAKKDEYL